MAALKRECSGFSFDTTVTKKIQCLSKLNLRYPNLFINIEGILLSRPKSFNNLLKFFIPIEIQMCKE